MGMIFKQELNQLMKIIENKNEFMLVSHVNPDGDNIGSIVGLALGLQQLNKSVVAVNADLTPQKYQFLANFHPVLDKSNGFPNDFSGVLIVLDCPELKRTGFNQEIFNSCAGIINIDHHISNKLFGSVNLVDVQAAATGEIVLKLLKELNTTFTAEIATALYTAIMTDTGSFRYSNTTSFSLEMAAFLLRQGADLNEINEQVYETCSLASVRFLAAALNKLQVHESGKIAWITIERKLSKEFGIDEEDYEGLVNYAKSLAGVEVAFLVKETENDNYKVSMRSKNIVDVNKVAAKFGGGGHKKAAGCIAQGYQTAAMLVADLIAEITKKLY